MVSSISEHTTQHGAVREKTQTKNDHLIFAMQTVKMENINEEELVERLKKGETLVYPTETTYGLGGDCANPETVAKIFKIKKRQETKPLLVVAANAAMMKEYVEWTPLLEKISSKYWPGPLTVVALLKKGASLPIGVVGADNTVAFRVTSHPFAARLSEILGRPIISTSANLASLESPYDISDVKKMFENSEYQPDLLIDAGVLPHRLPSTVARIIGDRIEILRQGEIVLK